VEIADSTSGYEGAKPRRVTRPKEFTEQLAFLVKEGTAERIEAVRGEVKKADFLRAAIDDAIAKAKRRKA
jgi:major membrane immunogen (membrane-anchored lipoprotein)